jgi:hypothetical protein
MRRLDCHNEIRQVKTSYETAREAIALLIEAVKKQHEYLPPHNLSLTALRVLAQELDSLFFTRMFDTPRRSPRKR